jgi:hypothetical protein
MEVDLEVDLDRLKSAAADKLELNARVFQPSATFELLDSINGYATSQNKLLNVDTVTTATFSRLSA